MAGNRSIIVVTLLFFLSVLFVYALTGGHIIPTLLCIIGLGPLFAMLHFFTLPQKRPQPAPTVFTLTEVASRFNLTEETVLELIKAKKLKARQIGLEYRITGESINHYLKLDTRQKR